MLEVRGLCVDYRAGAATLRAVDGLSLAVASGEAVGLLGESGCGKTTAALAIIGLLPPMATVAGSICFRGCELLGLPERDLERRRGAEIALIFQDPGAALNPVMRIGDQVAEVVRAHRRTTSRDCRRAAVAMLELVGFDQPARVATSYPQELSGGQRQRVAIAQALVSKPSLLIADEPTASLDAVAQSAVLALLKRLRTELRLSLLLISHRPDVLASMCDRIAVMYAGRIVESGAALWRDPLHPYTRALLGCAWPAPGNGGAAARRRLPVIPGPPPDPQRPAPGCPFEPRCSERMDACRLREPLETAVAGSRSVRCFLYGG